MPWNCTFPQPSARALESPAEAINAAASVKMRWIVFMMLKRVILFFLSISKGQASELVLAWFVLATCLGRHVLQQKKRADLTGKPAPMDRRLATPRQQWKLALASTALARPLRSRKSDCDAF